MSNNYQVVFYGVVAEGCKEEEVKKKLAILLKEDETTIAKLFCGKQVVIKRNASLPTCEKIQKAFRSVGAICSITNPNPELQTTSQTQPEIEEPQQQEHNKEPSPSDIPPSQSSDIKENIISKIADNVGQPKLIVSNLKEKFSRFKTEAAASIESDLEDGDVKVLLKNRYALTLLSIPFVFLALIIMPFIYDSNPMPLNDKNLTILAEHIDFIEKAFTTEELETRSKDKRDYLDYLLVKPVRKMEYDFNDTVIEISDEFNDDDFAQAELVKIKPYLELLAQERQKLNDLGFISASGKKQLDKVFKKLNGERT